MKNASLKAPEPHRGSEAARERGLNLPVPAAGTVRALRSWVLTVESRCSPSRPRHGPTATPPATSCPSPDVFLPLRLALSTLAERAQRGVEGRPPPGYPMKVALIESPGDLELYPQLFDPAAATPPGRYQPTPMAACAIRSTCWSLHPWDSAATTSATTSGPRPGARPLRPPNRTGSPAPRSAVTGSPPPTAAPVAGTTGGAAQLERVRGRIQPKRSRGPVALAVRGADRLRHPRNRPSGAGIAAPAGPGTPEEPLQLRSGTVRSLYQGPRSQPISRYVFRPRVSTAPRGRSV